MLAIVSCVAGAVLCVLPGNVSEYRVSVPVDTRRECVAVALSVIRSYGKDPRSYVVRCFAKGGR